MMLHGIKCSFEGGTAQLSNLVVMKILDESGAVLEVAL